MRRVWALVIQGFCIMVIALFVGSGMDFLGLAGSAATLVYFGRADNGYGLGGNFLDH